MLFLLTHSRVRANMITKGLRDQTHVYNISSSGSNNFTLTLVWLTDVIIYFGVFRFNVNTYEAYGSISPI